MKIEKSSQFEITLKDKDIDNFKTVITKIIKEYQIGFKFNLFTSEEKILLTQILDGLK